MNFLSEELAEPFGSDSPACDSRHRPSGNPRVIQKLAGWTTLRMLERYGHARDAEAQRAVTAMHALLERATNATDDQTAATTSTPKSVATSFATRAQTRAQRPKTQLA